MKLVLALKANAIPRRSRTKPTRVLCRRKRRKVNVSKHVLSCFCWSFLVFKQGHNFISTTLSYTRFILYPCYTAIAVSHMRLRTHTETQTRATQCVSVCKNRNKCLTKLMLFMCLYICEGVLTLASCSLKVFVLSI